MTGEAAAKKRSRGRRIVVWAAGILVGLAVLAGAIRVISLWSLGRIGFYSGEWVEFPADSTAGYDWPFRMYVPESDRPLRLWLRPNNTSVGATDDFEEHHEDAAQLLETSRWMADELEAAVLVPSFHRPLSQVNVLTHTLDRDTFVHPRPLGQIDAQLVAMSEVARVWLAAHGHRVCELMFIDGYSASGMFSNRFAMIHPERVAAAGVGAPGGWPMVPVAEHAGQALTYPVGVADLAQVTGRAFRPESVRRIPMRFFIGDSDDNDSTRFDDGYDPFEAETVHGLFGEHPQERWDDAERLWAGYPVEFEHYTDTGHEFTRQMARDLVAFFRTHDDRRECR